MSMEIWYPGVIGSDAFTSVSGIWWSKHPVLWGPVHLCDFFWRRDLRSDTSCSLFSINDLILSGWVFISINRKFVLSSPRKTLLDSAVVRQVCCLLSSARIVTVSLQFLNCPPMSKNQINRINWWASTKTQENWSPIWVEQSDFSFLTSLIINQISQKIIQLLD